MFNIILTKKLRNNMQLATDCVSRLRLLQANINNELPLCAKQELYINIKYICYWKTVIKLNTLSEIFLENLFNLTQFTTAFGIKKKYKYQYVSEMSSS